MMSFTLGPVAVAGIIQGLEGPGRGNVFLAEHDVVSVAVIGRGLARTQGYDPAAHRGIFEGLREMAAGIAAFAAKVFRCIIEGLLVSGPEHARLHAGSLVEFVDLQELVHVRAYHQGDATLERPAAEVTRTIRR